MRHDIPRVMTPEQELERLVRQQATDMKGNHSYWPGSGRHTHALTLDEMAERINVDVWDDPTGNAACG